MTMSRFSALALSAAFMTGCFEKQPEQPVVLVRKAGPRDAVVAVNADTIPAAPQVQEFAPVRKSAHKAFVDTAAIFEGSECVSGVTYAVDTANGDTLYTSPFRLSAIPGMTTGGLAYAAVPDKECLQLLKELQLMLERGTDPKLKKATDQVRGYVDSIRVADSAKAPKILWKEDHRLIGSDINVRWDSLKP